MKTIIAALVLGFTASTASADPSYRQDVALQEYCQTIARWARSSYDPPQILREEFRRHALKTFTSEGERNADVWLYAINYTYDKATNKENAYMMSWAYCMDNAN